jgi:hypothetical protein
MLKRMLIVINKALLADDNAEGLIPQDSSFFTNEASCYGHLMLQSSSVLKIKTVNR